MRAEDGQLYECRAKGRFRKEGVKPMPGDKVRILVQAGQVGTIAEIYPRRNELTRPMVANIDLLLIVVSADKPKPDLLLVDKLLLYGAYHQIPAAIGVNKCDTGGETKETVFREYAGSGARLLAFSAQDGTGIDEVKELLRGKCACFAGQSAVGKSSLLNALSPGLDLEIGSLSAKIDRGKHTTRHSELIRLEEIGAVAVDTPGFSILECMQIEPEALKDYYPEFENTECRFEGCLHWKEPDCGVKQKAEQGGIPAGRLERYNSILEELIERRRHQYD